MPVASLTIDTKAFMEDLKKLSNAARGKALEEAINAGGLELENEIKLHIEKNKLVKTGNLLNSIKKGPAKVSDTSAEVEVGTNVPYAARLEFGFSGADSLGRIYNQPARPYMRPAVDEGKDRIEQAVSATLKRNIEAVL